MQCAINPKLTYIFSCLLLFYLFIYLFLTNFFLNPPREPAIHHAHSPPTSHCLLQGYSKKRNHFVDIFSRRPSTSVHVILRGGGGGGEPLHSTSIGSAAAIFYSLSCSFLLFSAYGSWRLIPPFVGTVLDLALVIIYICFVLFYYR